MTGSKVAPVSLQKYEANQLLHADDLVAVEEPLGIRLGFGSLENRRQKDIAITMRTPGNDLELATGFLFTEGIIRHRDDLLSIDHCVSTPKQEDAQSIVRAELKPEILPDLQRLERHFYTTSSCGICGKSAINAVKNLYYPALPHPTAMLSAKTLASLPERLQQNQTIFRHTGGLHAAALCDAGGQLLLLREDVGRHNALDKLIGALLLDGKLPFSAGLIMVSGRAGFELIQKSVSAGIPVFAAVGAPSSLAVALAREYNQTLVGFLRNGRFNIYAGAERIAETIDTNFNY